MDDDASDQQTIVVEDATMRRGFVMLPVIILDSAVLTPGAKLAYALLLKYAWQDGQCFPGQQRMAHDMRVSRQSLSGYIAELVKMGAIRMKRRGLGKTNIYYLPRLDAPPEDVKPGRHQDVNHSGRPAVKQGRRTPVKRGLQNVYPDYVHTSTEKEIPHTNKYTRGRYALCPVCGERPHKAGCRLAAS